MKLKTDAYYYLLILFTTMLSACGGGGGTPPPTNNLSASVVEVQTADLQIAYPMKVSVSVSAAEDTDEVGVSLFVVERNDDPNAIPRQYPLDSHSISQLQAGSKTIELDVNIPSSIELAGQYYITAIIDPANVIAETDEEDNTVAVEVTLANDAGINIKLEELTLDRPALLINTSSYSEQVPGTVDNVHNADVAGTLAVAADGLAIDETIAIEGFAKLRMMRSDNGTTHDMPLYLWNSDQSRYMNVYGVDPQGGGSTVVEWLPLGNYNPRLAQETAEGVDLDDVDKGSSHLNFYLPGKLGSELEIAMRHLPVLLSPGPMVPPPDLTAEAIDKLRGFLGGLPSSGITGDESAAMAIMSFAICVELRPADTAMSDYIVGDNEACAPISIVLPPLPGQVSQDTPPGLSDTFVPAIGSASKRVNPVMDIHGEPTKMGSRMFGVDLDFGSFVSADHLGYKEGMHGYVLINLLNKTFEFAGIDINAQLTPEYVGKPVEEISQFTVEMRHVGNIVSRQARYPSDVTVALDIVSFSKEYPDPVLNEETGKKDPAIESTIVVGIFPFSMGAYAVGTIGVDYRPFVFTTSHPDGYRMGISGGPYVKAEAVAYAGLGSRRAGFITGVEGVLRLFDERIVFFNGVDIDVTSESNPVEFVIRRGPKITNELTGPQGLVNLFVKYKIPKIKTCKVGFVKFPCPGFKSIKVTKNLTKTKAAFKRKDVLYEKNDLLLDVVIPAGEVPVYYAPN